MPNRQRSATRCVPGSPPMCPLQACPRWTPPKGSRPTGSGKPPSPTRDCRPSPGRNSTVDGKPHCCSGCCSRRSTTPHEHRAGRSEEHTSELQSRFDLVCRLLLEKKKKKQDKAM